ncbi:hypothetical protein A3F34_02620 [Candidatus Roizmanbacteria bacterium RIFCSPHIGHO2_12_FULL_44_10]|uniref:Gluconeogenesis factor n=1 Tax=Candidatus Roizmanbacteria bacterium RIFCSPHIGHO2_12_FULL_44_10 TaxID=1802054 RepID=A0A1F7I5Q6_9BACT|nr:MAG: hypothetical protein A3F34_02620 [Candidatus Roizmanbacteria bacterium RIFCSPHIGHO2_12_FULL_44_10]
MKKVVVIGGGTGTFTVLTGIKDKPYEISVIVSMMDSGGSTGRLRDQFGVLPPGDIRQCLVALSEASDLWRKLFLYRFENGDFSGHNFGNIFLTALEKIAPDYQKVIDHASYILQTKGDVIPVTFDKVQLCATYENGETLESEELIDTASHNSSKITKAYLKPQASANRNALLAIEEADFIIIGPGDVYTSLISNLLVTGVKEAIMKSPAKIINIMNLMTKSGQTTNFKASDHCHDLEEYLGRKIDFVVVNTAPIKSDVLEHYEKHNEKPVIDDLPHDETIIRMELADEVRYNTSKADKHRRSILRHDPKLVADAIAAVIN